MDVLPMCSIFQELQIVHDTGYFSALPSLEEYWQQVNMPTINYFLTVTFRAVPLFCHLNMIHVVAFSLSHKFKWIILTLHPRCLDGVVSFTIHAITIGIVPKCFSAPLVGWSGSVCQAWQLELRLCYARMHGYRTTRRFFPLCRVSGCPHVWHKAGGSRLSKSDEVCMSFVAQENK